MKKETEKKIVNGAVRGITIGVIAGIDLFAITCYTGIALVGTTISIADAVVSNAIGLGSAVYHLQKDIIPDINEALTIDCYEED